MRAGLQNDGLISNESISNPQEQLRSRTSFNTGVGLIGPRPKRWGVSLAPEARRQNRGGSSFSHRAGGVKKKWGGGGVLRAGGASSLKGISTRSIGSNPTPEGGGCRRAGGAKKFEGVLSTCHRHRTVERNKYGLGQAGASCHGACWVGPVVPTRGLIRPLNPTTYLPQPCSVER